MSHIKVYLDNQPISDDNAEIERIARKSRMYHLIDGVLYKQGANGTMMKCISKAYSYYKRFTTESVGRIYHDSP
jgi:hypothetical protein